MMYKVIYKFADLQDNNHVYEVGDVYPREGNDPSFDRIRELASDKNKIGKPLIEEVNPMEYADTKVGSLEKATPKKNTRKRKKVEEY